MYGKTILLPVIYDFKGTIQIKNLNIESRAGMSITREISNFLVHDVSLPRWKYVKQSTVNRIIDVYLTCYFVFVVLLYKIRT